MIFCELIMQGWLNVIVLNKVSGMCQVSLWGTAGDHSRWSCSVTWENSQACPLSLILHEPLYSGLSFCSGDLWLHELDCIFFLQWTPQNNFFGITTYIQMVCLQAEFSKGVVFATWFTGLFSRVSWQALEISTRQSFFDSRLLLYLYSSLHKAYLLRISSCLHGFTFLFVKFDLVHLGWQVGL